jgi:DNA adenine methylase
VALIPYFGGKSRLAKTIISRLPKHDCYVEVFAGGASVLFAKDTSPAEILNDLDRDLITLYRTVKNHPEELYRQFKLTLVARDEFRRMMEINPDTLTDIQRAARYLYLQKSCFGGKVRGRTFGTSSTNPPRLNFLTLEQTIQDAWIRLAQVTIECLDFRDLIPRYDRPHTVFFLDPPYWCIPGYKHDFERQDFIDLGGVLRDIKGRFLMTLNDTKEVREIFSQYNIDEVPLTYSMSLKLGSRKQTRTELLISN